MTRTFLPWSLLAYLTWSGMVVVLVMLGVGDAWCGVGGWIFLLVAVFWMDLEVDRGEFRRQLVLKYRRCLEDDGCLVPHDSDDVHAEISAGVS
jgi:hypothetical protein